MTSTILETPRLSLTTLVAADAASMFRYRAHPDVQRFQGFAPTALADVEEFIERVEHTAFDTPGTWCQLALRLRETNELVGDVGVHTLPDGAQVELGITIAPEYQRHGLAREALVAVLDDLLLTRNKHRATASIDPRNTRCCALFETLGFRREALHIRSYRFRGAWVDDAVYAMLRSDWMHD